MKITGPYKNLHSTMYLLNPRSIGKNLYEFTYLHSTMYLLNLGR